MRTYSEAAEKDLRSCAIDRALEHDHVGRWKLAQMLSAYLTDVTQDAVDLKVQIELWADEHAPPASMLESRP